MAGVNRSPKVLLVLGLLAVTGMAFRVSWNALRDIARTIGADPTAAMLYPFVVDGLMALALVSGLVLTGRERTFAQRVLAGYVTASLILNYVHGLVPAIGSGSRVHLADWSPANWALVLLAASLPVGSIYFGSDLVAKVLHHRPEAVQDVPHVEPTSGRRGLLDRVLRRRPESVQVDQTVTKGSVSDLEQSADPTPVESAPVVADPPPAPVADPPEPVAVPAPAVRVGTVAVSRPRRATGSVPTAARSKRPVRTPSELLAEARSATAEWPDGHLTADRIREAVHTSAVNARSLRDALKAERASRTGLHAVPDTAVQPQGPAPATGYEGDAPDEGMAS